MDKKWLIIGVVVFTIAAIVGFVKSSGVSITSITDGAEESVTSNSPTNLPEEPTCTLKSDKTEVQAGVEKYTVTWTSKNADYAIWNYPSDLNWKRSPQGSESHLAFDGLTEKATYYFYGKGGSTSCSVTVKVSPTRVIPSFPAPLIKLEVGGTITSADGKYSLTYVSNDGPSGITVTVKTPEGLYTNTHIPNSSAGKKFGNGIDALNVNRCSGIGDGRDEFTFSLGDNPTPECVSRVG